MVDLVDFFYWNCYHLERYFIEDGIVELIYNSNHISSAEILENIVSQTVISEVSIRKPDLADAILKIQSIRMED